MMNREPIIFKAHLMQGEEQIAIEAIYASQFSLSIRFLNGNKADQETIYRKLVFQKNGDPVEIGPCQFIPENSDNCNGGRIVFYQDVYDLNSLFFDDKLEKLQAEFFNLPLIIAHKNKIKKPFKENKKQYLRCGDVIWLHHSEGKATLGAKRFDRGVSKYNFSALVLEKSY